MCYLFANNIYLCSAFAQKRQRCKCAAFFDCEKFSFLLLASLFIIKHSRIKIFTHLIYIMVLLFKIVFDIV